MFGVAVVCLLVVQLLLVDRQVRQGSPPTALLGVGVALCGLLAVAIPGLQLTSGRRISLLQPALHTTLATTGVQRAYWLFLACIISFSAGQILGTPRKHSATPEQETQTGDASRRVYWLLLVTGFAATLLITRGPQALLINSRGQLQGQGPLTLISYGVPLGIAIGVLRRHWTSRLTLFASLIVGLAYLDRSPTRTPLLIVAAAVAVRAVGGVPRRKWRPFVLLLGGALAILVCVVVAGSLSVWRADIAAGRPASFAHLVAHNARSPLDGIASTAHLDTLDGLILTQLIRPSDVAASALDPIKALEAFVPSQFWPNKPEFLGAIVASKYLGYGGHSGIFLSGPGYLFLISGGIVGAVLGFFLLGLASARALVSQWNRDKLLVTLIIYFVVRFTIAGDAFDLFHVAGLAVLYVFARWIATGRVARLRPFPGAVR